jgi:hypothetical protein
LSKTNSGKIKKAAQTTEIEKAIRKEMAFVFQARNGPSS